jgi:penicillin-insensitive murein endopeptidase
VHRLAIVILFMVMSPLTAAAQDTDALPAADAATLAAIANQTINAVPAKKLFGAQKTPANMAARSFGTYARGCLAGGQALPVNGPAWQVMRLSRNRNWGHPKLIALLERLAEDAREKDGWNGLLVGDISQPRGGPMLTGHNSHQIGLDADIWLTPMPDRVLTRKERENISAKLVVKDRKTMDYSVWTDAHARLIKRAASYPEVERIFVHPPIKKELCRWATGDRSWLAKVRPYYGHNFHFHVRIKCQNAGCKDQGAPNPKDGTGCGEELAYWYSDAPWKPPKRDPNAKPPKPPKPLTIKALPAECRSVVTVE